MVKSLTLNVKGGERRYESGVKYEGGRAERSDLLMMFRPLYFSGQRDVSGFLKVAAMLRTHAEDKCGDPASRAVEMIAQYEAEHHGALAQSRGLELRMSGGKEVMEPKTLLKLFLHGGDFHMDERLADYLEGLSPITWSVLEWEYLGRSGDSGLCIASLRGSRPRSCGSRGYCRKPRRVVASLARRIRFST